MARTSRAWSRSCHTCHKWRPDLVSICFWQIWQKFSSKSGSLHSSVIFFAYPSRMELLKAWSVERQRFWRLPTLKMAGRLSKSRKFSQHGKVQKEDGMKFRFVDLSMIYIDQCRVWYRFSMYSMYSPHFSNQDDWNILYWNVLRDICHWLSKNKMLLFFKWPKLLQSLEADIFNDFSGSLINSCYHPVSILYPTCIRSADLIGWSRGLDEAPEDWIISGGIFRSPIPMVNQWKRQRW